MTDWSSLDYAVVDVEGNGQQPPELVELAVVPIVGGAIQVSASWLVKPEHPITHIASRIHGITAEDVAGKPAFDGVADAVRASLDVSVLVTHNAPADIAVLRRQLPAWDVPEVFDTLRLARRLLPDQPGYRLGMLVQALGLAGGLPDGLAPHRAAYDAMVTARLFVWLALMSGKQPLTLEELRGDPPNEDGHDAQPLF